jgi:glycosyltransferase involved in cell wall biosynthesis
MAGFPPQGKMMDPRTAPPPALSERERRSLWIVIAAYNEGPAIAAVIADVLAEYPNVLVVDDGSSDNSAEEARAAGATVIRHVVNLGQGAALQTGIRYALARGAQAIVTFDADGQHLVEDIPTLARPVLDGEAEVALGSRFLGRAENITTAKLITLRLAILFTRLTTGVNFTDAHNGFRCLSPAAARKIRIQQDRMAHASEILDQIALLKLTYVEVPVTIRYTDYSKQKGQRISNSLHILADLFVARID